MFFFISVLILEAVAQLPQHILQTRAGLPMDNSPVHFHLSFAGKTTNGMTIAWETDSDTDKSMCNYGIQSGKLSSQAVGFSRTDESIFTHVVTINDLEPSTQYIYACGDGSQFSSEHSFTTALAPGRKDPFVFALVGDMGIRQSNGVTASMEKHMDSFDFIYHIGDVGYADDAVLYLSTYDKVYSTFMEQIEPMSSTMAYMAMPGNHEATCNEAAPFLCPDHQKNFTAWRTRWQMPCAESGGVENMWYSFDYGMIHFIQISTETDFDGAPEGDRAYLRSGPFGDQLTWLEADLVSASANRANVPWIIVSGHRPMYYSGGANKHVQAAFLPLLTKYKVDFYFSGHEHNYERYWPIGTDGKVSQTDYNNPSDIVYIVNGAGGNAEGHESSNSKADYLAYRDTSHYGWSRVTVYNTTTIKWEYITDEDSVEDEAVIYKQH